MNTDILFNNEKEKEATERVLAMVRIKSINKEIDDYLSDMLKYATNIDTILDRNGLNKRYLDRVSEIGEDETLTLDEDLNDIDFRVKETVENLIKRINTRLKLIHDNDEIVKELESTYDLSDADFDQDIKDSHLTDQADE